LKSVKKRTIILDTSAFISGLDPFSIKDEQLTVPMVEKELTPNSLPWIRFKTSVERGKIFLKESDQFFFNEVVASSKKIGDFNHLSEVDLSILALAHEKNVLCGDTLLLTDDYSIQNVANYLGITFSSVLTFGISTSINWISYCPGCKKKYSDESELKTCEICGTKLKRKPLNKKRI
jgi:UPF0271 protein